MRQCCGNQPISWRTLILILAVVLALLAVWRSARGDELPPQDNRPPVEATSDTRETVIHLSQLLKEKMDAEVERMSKELVKLGCKRGIVSAFMDEGANDLKVEVKCVSW